MKKKALLLEILLMTLITTAWSQNRNENPSLEQLKQEKKKVDKKVDSLRVIATQTSTALTKTGSDLEAARDNKTTANKIVEIQNKQKKLQITFDKQLVLLDSLAGMQYYLDSAIKKKTALSKGSGH